MNRHRDSLLVIRSPIRVWQDVVDSRFRWLRLFYRTYVLFVNGDFRPLASTVLLHVQKGGETRVENRESRDVNREL